MPDSGAGRYLFHVSQQLEQQLNLSHALNYTFLPLLSLVEEPLLELAGRGVLDPGPSSWVLDPAVIGEGHGHHPMCRVCVCVRMCVRVRVCVRCVCVSLVVGRRHALRSGLSIFINVYYRIP